MAGIPPCCALGAHSSATVLFGICSSHLLLCKLAQGFLFSYGLLVLFSFVWGLRVTPCLRSFIFFLSSSSFFFPFFFFFLKNTGVCGMAYPRSTGPGAYGGKSLPVIFILFHFLTCCSVLPRFPSPLRRRQLCPRFTTPLPPPPSSLFFFSLLLFWLVG